MKSSRIESWVRMGNGYESLYYISNQGRIVNIKTGLEENRNHAPRVRLRNRMGVEFEYDVASLVSSNFKPGVIGFMWGYEGKEEWREIPGYPKYYKVSNLGRVIGRDKSKHQRLLLGKNSISLFDQYGNRRRWSRDALVSYVFDNHTWVDIPGFIGLYQINEEGRIRSFKSGQPKLLNDQLEVTLINKDGRRKSINVESLMKRLFQPKIKKYQGEIFKYIPGHEGKYMVSNRGRILAKNYKGSKYEKIISQSKPGQVILAGKFYSVQKLVSEVFKDAKK